jgi:hypothetical protein
LTGYTTYGRSIQYWELANKDEFLIRENGERQEYVHEGDAILRYHAGNTRLLLYESVRRHYYYAGDETGDTIQYIVQLSSSNALVAGGLLMQQTSPQAAQGREDADLNRLTPSQYPGQGYETP